MNLKKIQIKKEIIKIGLIAMLTYFSSSLAFEIENRGNSQWYTIFLNGAKIGYQFINSHNIIEDSTVLWTTEIYTFIEMYREDEKVGVSKRINYYESDQLMPIRYELRLLKSLQEIYIMGKVSKGNMIVTKALGDSAVQSLIELPENTLFSSAIGKKIQQAGLEIGKLYTFQVFLPDLEQVVKTEILIQDKEKLNYKDMVIDGYKLKLTYNYSQNVLDYYIWVNKEGMLYKSYSPTTNLTMTLVSKEEALEKLDVVEMFNSTSIKSDVLIEHPDEVNELLAKN